MKNLSKIIFSALLLAFSAAAYAEDKYDQLANEITEAGSEVQGKKIAIIPFSYADGRAGASKDGSVIAERLTIKMINKHKFEIIERSVLDKVMTELKLQSSGMIDASSAQQLGKVLGVEAIVTGTLVETSGGEIEVNARLIKTETAQAIGASQVNVQKNWIGDTVSVQQYQQPSAVQPAYAQPAYQQPAYQPAAQPSYQQPAQAYQTPQQSYQKPAGAARQRGEHEYGFVDVFMGFGAPNMDLKFENSNRNITLNNSYDNDLGIRIGYTNDFESVEMPNLKTAATGPIAFRVGGFGKGALGADFELSYSKCNATKQTADWKLNGYDAGSITLLSDDYVTVKSFGLSGDILIRHPGTVVDPYIGLGLGMSLNSITLPYVKGFTNSSAFARPVEDFGVGLMFRIPVGLRVKLGSNTQLVAELRYEMNYIMFDRGSVSGESDTITLSGAKFNVGMGFTF